MFRHTLCVLGACCLVALSGCRGDGPVPVTGTVTYKGTPLAQGTITFTPEEGRVAFGKIKDGKIVEVTTHTLDDGAAKGRNRVSIRSISNPDDMYAKQVSLIPEKYGDPNTSGLTAELASGTNELSFDLR
jgi:hypothetical protein